MRLKFQFKHIHYRMFALSINSADPKFIIRFSNGQTITWRTPKHYKKITKRIG